VQDWIVEANLAPGDRLPSERELAEQLGVSRPSVRQALKVLTSLGVLEQRHGSGTYIKSPVKDPVASLRLAQFDTGDEGLADVSDLRASIDALAMRLAAERATPDDLDRLERFLAERAGELRSEPASPGSLDLRFEARVFSGKAVADSRIGSQIAGLGRLRLDLVSQVRDMCP
jgi:GntR family transcriptional repressor for pyruvate dehydrogenase complex